MNQDQNNLALHSYESIKREVAEYNKLIQYKNSRYSSLADMKRQLYAEIVTYSEEDLDFLKEFIKAKIVRTDKAFTGFLPIWAAIVIALFGSMYKDAIPFTVISLIITLFLAELLSERSIQRLGFYNMLIELIEKAEHQRGHTFNDGLAETSEISTTIN